MAIPLTGTGGLFTRLGKIGKTLNDLNSFRGSTTLGPDIDAIAAQFQSTQQNLIDGIYSVRDSYRLSHSTLTGALQQLALNTLIEMAHADVALVTKDLPTAMDEVISQMKAAAASVEGTTVSVSVTAAPGNVSDGVVIASVKNFDGKDLQYPFAETLELTVTGDAQVFGTAGSEPFSLFGEIQQTDPLFWDWPKGSEARQTGTLVNPSNDATDNLLTNSDFESFTVPDAPDNWTLSIGTAGGTIFAAGAGDAYHGSKALKITGDGLQLTTLDQKFNDPTKTAGRLEPNTVYAVTARVKVSSVPAAGVLRFAFVDGNDAVFNDASGTANSFTVSLPEQTNSYAVVSGFFRTPAVLPAVQKFQIKLTTPLDEGVSVFIDRLAVAKALQAYPGGPYVGAFSGKTAAVTGDKWHITTAVTLGGFQKLFERLFGMRALGKTLPFSASPTISDTLLT